MRRLIYSVVVFSIVTGAGGGCSFISRTYQNTIAYFNTYYNAQKAFDDAVRELEKIQPTTLQTNLFIPSTASQQVKQKFQSVIEKCSKIIQFYPETDLVDDAILLIGKSYYYLNEVVPAQKKFSEILDNFSSSALRAEAKLMLAKTYYLADRRDDALSLINTLIEESLEKKEWDVVLEGLLLSGQIYIDRDDFARALQSFVRALDTPGDERLLAYASYLSGQCHESLGNYGAAAHAFLAVRDYAPPLSLEFHGRLRAASMFSMIGNTSRSLEVLEELRSEPLNPEQKSLVELEFGRTYQRGNEYEKAISHYTIVDTVYKRTDASAKSNYYLGTIYETHFSDLRQAKVFFDKAKNEFPQSEITSLAAKKAETLGRYISYRKEFNKYDSLLSVHFRLREEKGVDSSLQQSSAALDSAKSGELTSADSLQTSTRVDSARATPVPIDTIHYRRSINQLALGILFLVDLENADSAAYWLTLLLNEYPDTKLTPQALYVLSEVYRGLNDEAKVDSLYEIILRRYPDSEYAKSIRKGKEQFPIDAAPSDSVSILYAHAVRMLEGGKAQQAIQDLRRILLSDSTHPLNARARYAMGWIYENVVLNVDSAIAQYRRLAQDHPHSVYTARVRPKLAFIDNKESEQSPPASSTIDTSKAAVKPKNGDAVEQEIDAIRKPEDKKKTDFAPKKDDQPD